VKHCILYALSISLLGYALLALSALAVALVVWLAAGYFPCLTCFTLALLTFRLTELHWTPVFFPPLAAACAIVSLSRARLNRRLVAGLGQSAPYLLVALVYATLGARESQLEVAAASTVWAFVVGTASCETVEIYRLGWV
jgi:hypothetical protein